MTDDESTAAVPQAAGDGRPTAVWEVDTASGTARVHHHAVGHGRPRATLVLGHGVGRGVDAPDLVAIAAALPAIGVEVVLVEQPWHVAGRRLGGPGPTLDAAWRDCVADLRGRGIGTRRLVCGGRSSGARVACRTVDEVGPAALLLLAFPLWPARRPPLADAPSRLPELVAAARRLPTVVVQGTRDRMGPADEVAVGLAEQNVTARVVPIPEADHAFAVPRSSGLPDGAALGLVVRAARATALRIVDGHY
jgi:predicted alpha/beta-hydrolase family hydrolase